MKKNLENNEEVLKSFIASIEPPYNIVEFARLGIEPPEEFVDIITTSVMNFPVTLYGRNFDFDTLDLLNVNANDTRADPFTKKLFTWADVSPNYELYTKIKAAINTASKARKEIVRTICKAAKDGDVAELERLFISNPQITLNEEFSNGYAALHYACKASQLDCAKYLVKIGADLDLLSCDSVTPFMLIQKNHPTITEELKQYLIDFLTHQLDAKDATSYIRYAKLLLNGRVMEPNITKAIELLIQAGELGEPAGYTKCADIYANGLYGVDKDLDKALSLYDKSIQLGDTSAKFKKCSLQMHEDLPFLPLPPSQVIADLASSFDPDALFLRAMCFYGGFDVSRSNYKFIKYLKYAADQGVGFAQYDYAIHCRKGDIVKEDLEQSAKYMKMAADTGWAKAQHDYACYCVKGLGVAINPIEATKYMKMAADNGSAEAQYDYAVFCAQGKGIEQNFEQAAKYYKMAADQGDPEAQNNYARYCAEGKGIDKDLEQAAIYFKLAADQGLGYAQYNCAMCYLSGEGVEPDIDVGLNYLKMAAENGFEEAVNKLALIFGSPANNRPYI